LITRPSSVEKFGEKLVQTVPSQIPRVTSATRSRPRATSCAWPRQAAPPADRARLRSTAATAGAPLQPPIPRLLHRRSHPILPFRVPHAHGPRETDLRRQPTTSPPYARRAAPGQLLALTPRHRLAHAAAHRAVTLVTPSPRHTAYISPAVFPRASTQAPPRSPLPPPVSTSLRSRLWPVEHD
jgi:hypothetical protein